MTTTKTKRPIFRHLGTAAILAACTWTFALTSTAHAIDKRAGAVRYTIDPTSLDSDHQFLDAIIAGGGVEDYQVGSEWGKHVVQAEVLRQMPKSYARTALATARYGGATAFYLGKINGHYLMATNHHVMPKADLCNTREAIFPMLKKKFHCAKFFGEWKAIDLALFSIKIDTKEDVELMESVKLAWDFVSPISPRQSLVTMGFGIFSNPERKMVANADSDCKVFSQANDFRLMGDPDEINPADYEAWSFSMGCDISHGDSGSAMVDRLTGKVIGIAWTVGTQKPDRIRDSSFIETYYKDTENQDIWRYLSYAVPGAKIYEVLSNEVVSLEQESESDQDVTTTLREFLKSGLHPDVRGDESALDELLK